MAVNVPEMALAVCDAIWYWKLPHVLGLGTVAGASRAVHTPTSDWVPAVGVPPVPLVPPVPPLVLAGALGAVGLVTLVECWNPQSAPARHAARIATAVTELFI